MVTYLYLLNVSSLDEAYQSCKQNLSLESCLISPADTDEEPSYTGSTRISNSGNKLLPWLSFFLLGMNTWP